MKKVEDLEKDFKKLFLSKDGILHKCIKVCEYGIIAYVYSPEIHYILFEFTPEETNILLSGGIVEHAGAEYKLL